MQKVFLIRSVTAVAALAVLSCASGARAAAITYGGATFANTNVQKLIAGNPAGTVGVGDDYTTNSLLPTTLLTGLSFKGGNLSSNSNLSIDFYSTAGVRVASIVPNVSEVATFGVNTLAASDFMQNGITGVPIPSTGYIIFTPYSTTTSDANTGVTTVGNPNPSIQIAAGAAAAPIVGTNNSALAAQTTADPTTGLPTLSTGVYYFGFGTTPQYAAFTLSTVPEPTTLAAVASLGTLAFRRRRQTAR